MRILMVNKFLHPNGGSETYIFKLGAYLQANGHEVQYFGMDHADRVVGNQVDAYTESMDFHGGSMLSKLLYPIKTIYSVDARRKIRRVLDAFQPDVCHLNNFNYQLTPSIILGIRKWEKDSGHRCRIIYTAHDYQLVCPNHMCHNPNTHVNCEKCLHGSFLNCTKGKCIHGSTLKSLIGSAEALLWNAYGVYKELDTIICCSHFMKTKLDTVPVLKDKTVVLHNFVERTEQMSVEKKAYILYFGRYSQEKGIATLVEVAKQLPHISFVFAGSGPLEELLNGIPNIYNVGFKSGEALEKLIREAKFTVYPSEWYENCPFSVMESQLYGTPVLGADIGGIPELIHFEHGSQLFESGNAQDLREKIEGLWNAEPHGACVSCAGNVEAFLTIDQYVQALMEHYSCQN